MDVATKIIKSMLSQNEGTVTQPCNRYALGGTLFNCSDQNRCSDSGELYNEKKFSATENYIIAHIQISKDPMIFT